MSPHFRNVMHYLIILAFAEIRLELGCRGEGILVMWITYVAKPLWITDSVSGGLVGPGFFRPPVLSLPSM